METVLVTGGAGFIGSHTCKTLAAHGFLPVAFDDLSRGHADFVRWGPLVQGDILDLAALNAAFERYRPGAVMHFAALAYVGESMSRPLAYYRINVAGLVNVIEAMLRYATRTIVFSSSCATYGIPDRQPIAENAPQHPVNPYGQSKLVGEHILTHARSAEDLRVAILRYFNAAGADPEGELVERHNPETHLIPLAIDAATGRGPPLQIFGTDYPTADGTCERDFVHVSDLAAAAPKEIFHGDPRCRDHWQFRIGRVRRRTEMLARHHKPENLPNPEQRSSRKRAKRYRQIFRAGIDHPSLHTS